MWAVFRHQLRRFRGSILGWGIILGLLAAAFVSVFSSIDAQMEQLQQLIQQFPTDLFAFFGVSMESLTALGLLDIKFFSYMPMVLGIFAVAAGSGLLAGDEEKGLLDLVMSHPVSRREFFFGRVLAFLAALAAIPAIIWGGFAVAIGQTVLDVSPLQIARPLVSLGAMVLLFGTLALLLSMVLPSRRMASSVAGLLLVASFFITGMAELDPGLKAIADFSPFSYYQGGKAITDGLNVGWIIGLLVPAVVFTLLAWWRFERRDIRVAGEGGWRLALPGRNRPARQRPSEARQTV